MSFSLIDPGALLCGDEAHPTRPTIDAAFDDRRSPRGGAGEVLIAKLRSWARGSSHLPQQPPHQGAALAHPDELEEARECYRAVAVRVATAQNHGFREGPQGGRAEVSGVSAGMFVSSFHTFACMIVSYTSR